jgi:hypothetical protein
MLYVQQKFYLSASHGIRNGWYDGSCLFRAKTASLDHGLKFLKKWGFMDKDIPLGGNN